MRHWATGFFILTFYFITTAVTAQRTNKPDTINQEPHYFKSRFTPFIAPSVSPEIDFMLVAGGLYAYKLNPNDTAVQPSTLPFSIGYSTNKSFLFNLRPNIFFDQDRYRVRGDIWVKDMPYNYWGVGYDKNSSIEQGESTTSFWRYWSQIDLIFNRQITGDLYAGLAIDHGVTKASQLSPRMKTDDNVMDDGTEIKTTGLGLNAEYDSRDLIVNPYDGMFLNINWIHYNEILGSQFDYSTITFDYRQYESIVRKGRTLAWQLKSRISNGDVPWPEMSQLGTPFDLRGYIWGQYRDEEMIFGLVEYRHMFLRKNPDEDGSFISKHGAVVWVGSGSVAPALDEFQHVLPNAGIGYRFEIQSRMNARLDFGIGKSTSAFYVSFNEAF